QGKNKRCRSDRDDPDASKNALPGNTVCKRTGGCLAEDGHDGGDRKSQSDLLLRPPEARQIEDDEGAKPGLKIGDEKVGPVETAAAVAGVRDLEAFPRVSVSREGSTQAADVSVSNP